MLFHRNYENAVKEYVQDVLLPDESGLALEETDIDDLAATLDLNLVLQHRQTKKADNEKNNNNHNDDDNNNNNSS